jgi:hypothetical protein
MSVGEIKKAGAPNPVAAKSKATKSTAMKNLAENNPRYW